MNNLPDQQEFVCQIINVFGERNFQEVLDFTVDCLVDSGTVKGRGGKDCKETSTRDAKKINERLQLIFT